MTDPLGSINIGPGTVHTRLELEQSGSFHFLVSEQNDSADEFPNSTNSIETT